MTVISQAIVSYIVVIVCLNGIASSLYFFSPALKVRNLRASVRYFSAFYLLMAVGFLVYGYGWPTPSTFQAIITNSAFLLAFYCLRHAFWVRKDPHVRHLYKHKMFYVNWLLLLAVNIGVFSVYVDSHLMRTAFLASNCSIVAVLAIKHVGLSRHGYKQAEKIALAGIWACVLSVMLLLVTLNNTENMFTYFSAMMLAQAVIAMLILGGSQAIFFSDLSDSYYRESITDELTGLYNRRYFLRQSEVLVKTAERHQFPISIILCDIDYFKKINDEHGHEAGDRVLEVFASILKDSTREGDIIARFGGEEFIILLPQTDIDGASMLAERIRHATEAAQVAHHSDTLSVTSSFGVVSVDHSEELDHFIRQVDVALYKAKALGRNRVVTQTLA